MKLNNIVKFSHICFLRWSAFPTNCVTRKVLSACCCQAMYLFQICMWYCVMHHTLCGLNNCKGVLFGLLLMIHLWYIYVSKVFDLGLFVGHAACMCIRLLSWKCLAMLNTWSPCACTVILVLSVCQSCSHISVPPSPEGRPGISDVSPLSGISGLSFDSTFLSAVVILPSPVVPSVFSFPCFCLVLQPTFPAKNFYFPPKKCSLEIWHCF